MRSIHYLNKSIHYLNKKYTKSIQVLVSFNRYPKFHNE